MPRKKKTPLPQYEGIYSDVETRIVGPNNPEERHELVVNVLSDKYNFTAPTSYEDEDEYKYEEFDNNNIQDNENDEQFHNYDETFNDESTEYDDDENDEQYRYERPIPSVANADNFIDIENNNYDKLVKTYRDMILIHHEEIIDETNKHINLTVHDDESIRKLHKNKKEPPPEEKIELNIGKYKLIVWKNKDGTIHSNKRSPIQLPDPNIDKLERSLGRTKYGNSSRIQQIELIENVITHILEKYQSQYPTNFKTITDFYSNEWGLDYKNIQQEAIYDALHEIPNNKLINDIQKDYIQGEAESIVRNWIDKETWNLINNKNEDPAFAHLRGSYSNHTYNKILTNIELYKDLVNTHPGIVGWMLHDKSIPIEKYDTASDIVEIAKAKMKDNNIKYWRNTSQISPIAMMNILSTPRPDIFLNAAGDTQIAPTLANTQLALYVGEELLEKNVTAISESNAKNVYKLLLTTDLDSDRDYDPSTIVDYVKDLNDKGKPLTSTTYKGLMKAVRKYNDSLLHKEEEERIDKKLKSRKGYIEKWNPGIDRKVYNINDQEIEIVPLTNPIELLNEGKYMKNCIVTYQDDCIRGDHRAFSVRKDGKQIATALLEQRDGEWRAVQTRAKRNQKPSEEVLLATRNLSEEFRERERKGNIEHQLSLIHHETGDIKPYRERKTRKKRAYRAMPNNIPTAQPAPIMPPALAAPNFSGNSRRRPPNIMPRLPGQRRRR